MNERSHERSPELAVGKVIARLEIARKKKSVNIVPNNLKAAA